MSQRKQTNQINSDIPFIRESDLLFSILQNSVEIQEGYKTSYILQCFEMKSFHTCDIFVDIKKPCKLNICIVPIVLGRVTGKI